MLFLYDCPQDCFGVDGTMVFGMKSNLFMCILHDYRFTFVFVSLPVFVYVPVFVGMRQYVSLLEQTVIRCCAAFNLQAVTSPHTGVWVQDKKIAAIGELSRVIETKFIKQ